MNAHVGIPPADHRSDRAFLRQLKIATREQLRAMLEVFTRLCPDGAPENAYSFKRAAVERKLGINRNSFGWIERDEWWNE